MIPTININLFRCICRQYGEGEVRHFQECQATPAVLIPCPIPRSVTFEVRMGECGCGSVHRGGCPCAPIRVSCSIGGKTWGESEVVSVERCDGALMKGTGEDVMRVVALCRELWALVKALVLNDDRAKDNPKSPYWDLMYQRDAVFSALADMARAEEAVWQAQERACRIVYSSFVPDNFMNAEPHSRPSASILERYINRLIEQVGVLP